MADILDQVSLEIRIEGLDEKTVKTLYKSLLPEIKSQPDKKRGKIELKGEKGQIVISMSSSDAGDLRALFNAYIYLLITALEVIRE